MARCLMIFSLFLLFLSACSAGTSKPKLKGDYKVSITTDGKSVQDFNDKLVFYYDVTKTELQNYLHSKEKAIGFPFNVIPSLDSEGRIAHLQLISVNPDIKEAFGLKTGDSITAIGKQPPKSEKDFEELLKKLDAGEKESVTLQREGKAHKIYYYPPEASDRLK